jgi:hypothetical protein
MKKLFFCLFFCLVSAGMTGASMAADIPADFPKLQQPVLLTSLGQAPDVHTMSVLAKRAKVAVNYKALATPEDAANAKTIMVNVGVSLKGFGSAGVNLDTEIARINAIFKVAKEKNIPVILTHIGGEERRDNMSNVLLEVAVPQVDAFIVYARGNKDGYFTKAAGDKPIISVPKTMKIIDVLKNLK